MLIFITLQKINIDIDNRNNKYFIYLFKCYKF